MTRTAFAPLSSNDKVIYDVLLTYSKIHLNHEETARLETALTKIENFNLFTERAVACHLAPLIHRALTSVNHTLPAKVTSTFATAYNQVLVRNIRMYEVFKTILQDLNRANIDCMPMKGIYLADSVYQDFGLRHLSDIDFLVHEKDAMSVCEIMRSKGWAVKVIELRSEFEQTQFSPANPFTFFKDGVMIELHTRLFNLNLGMQLNEETLWSYTQEENFCEGKIRQLGSEMLLIYLCLHLHKHLLSWEAKVVSFCDIRELLIQRTDNFNWVECKRLCSENKCNSQVTEALQICRKYWSIEVPDSFFEGTEADLNVEQKFLQFLTGKASQQTQVAENVINRSRSRLRTLNGFGAKLRYVLGYAFPRQVFMYRRFQLKEGTFLLPWYFLRIGILFGKLILGMLNRIRGVF